MPDCPLCGSPDIKAEYNHYKYQWDFNCPRCGDFTSCNDFYEDYIRDNPSSPFRKPEALTKLSHAVRRAQRSDRRRPYPEIALEWAEAVLKQPLPSVKEQADFMIRWIAENTGFGEEIIATDVTHGAIIGSKNEAGFQFITEHLENSGLIIRPPNRGLLHIMHLSPKGWERYEELKRGVQEYRKAFVAMKFGDPQLDPIVEEVFKPAVARAGFELFKLDDDKKAGLIDNKLRVAIQTSDFVIADLTHDNLGAYWEAGYAEGLGKAVIYTCEKSKFDAQKTHFDTNHHLTICWVPEDKERHFEASEELTATIRATLPHLAKMHD